MCTPEKNDVEGDMLMNLVAAVAVAGKIDPKKVAKVYADVKGGRKEIQKWLIEMAEASLDIGMGSLVGEKGKKVSKFIKVGKGLKKQVSNYKKRLNK